MAEREFPTSYKDPLYASLDSATEAKLNLPPGLLSSIRLNGEQTNHGRVSEKGATTPYQFIPSTRDAVIKKYGIDPLLSPENASEAAGLLLQESLKRNQGDVAAAAAEYHAGPNRKLWGPRTRSYVERVTGAIAAPVRDAEVEASPIPAAAAGAPQSTFDRVSGQMGFGGKAPANAIANVFAAYQSGRMTPQESAEFEQDVQAGRVMLPRGASLKQPQGGGAMQLPAGVVDAYVNGKMTPQEKAELEADVQAGRVALPAGMQQAQGGGIQAAIPGSPQMPPQPQPAPSLADRAIGAGEAALSTATGMTGGAVGGAVGLGRGLVQAIQDGTFGTSQAADMVARSIEDGAAALTYQPRTATGQDYTEAVGQVMQAALPAMPVAHGMMPPGAAAPARAAAVDAARAVPGAVADVGRAAVKKVGEPVGWVRDMVFDRPAERPTAGTFGSAGAAGADVAAQRVATAEQLPVPIKLTKGQATRDFEAQRFEGETAKDGTNGAPLRDRFAEQNQQLAQNFEAMIDGTGAMATNAIETGRAVDSGIRTAAAKQKARYRTLYKEAEKAKELDDPVSVEPLARFLSENESLNQGNLAGGSLGLLQRELVRLGGAEMRDGQLIPGELSLRNVELLRRQMNNAIDSAPDNATNMRAGVQAKEVIDQITEGMGGDLYKEARLARRRYAQLFENNGITSQLLRNKRGSADRQVALEDVFRKTVLNGSREDLHILHRSLRATGGEEGRQAWKELQGATVRHLLDESTKGVGTDVAGNPIFSAAKLNNAVRAMEADGKLELLLGKKGAQTIRDLNEISKVVKTQPPGAINSSNTAGVILAALAEAGATGSMTGLPVPVLSTLKAAAKFAKDRKVAQRVNEALRYAEARDRAQSNMSGGSRP